MTAQTDQPQHRSTAQKPTNRPILAAVGAGLIVCLGVVIVAGAQRYHPFLSDDALISLRYAKRLLAGQGLTWTEGPRVEGYSNLLWVLLVSALGWMGLDLIQAARLLGYGLMSLAGAAVVWCGLVRHHVRGLLGAAMGGLFLALSAPVAVWAIGGLEQPLIAALLAWAMVFTFRVADRTHESRYFYLASFCFGLLSITRPDGPIFAVATVAALVLGNRFSRKSLSHAAKLLLFPALFIAGQLLFRLVYYRDWIPNTARVKISPSDTHLVDGVRYVAGGFMALSPLSWCAVAALIALVAVKRTRIHGLVLAFNAVLWAAYVVFIGGDIFPAWRHIIPMIVLFALALSEGVNLLWSESETRPVRLTVTILLFLSFIPFLSLQQSNSENQRAIHERWEWDGEVLGLLLKEAFGDEQPLFAVSAAGTLPYFSELPVVDMYGLSDPFIARNPPDDFGEGRIGHELGDGAYVLSREPDLVSFCGPAGRYRACSRSGKEMAETEEFAQEYAPILFKGETPYEFIGMVWVRKYSDRIGIQQDEQQITVPGYLLAEQSDHDAYLDADGQLVVSVPPQDDALTLTLYDLADGEWQAQIDASYADEIRYSIESQADGNSELSVWSEGEHTPEIRSLTLHHTPDENE
ncbi:MAG: hypothetical protein QM346_08230 [Chloroflexota bacterium]|nr:hypothetical protein [Chloroflexota bacterium]